MATDSGTLPAFGFIGGTVVGPASFLTAAVEILEVRFAARVVGNHLAFVAVAADDLANLQDAVIPAVHEAGGRGVRWSVALAGEAMSFGRPVKRMVTPTGALVRIRTSQPAATLAALEARLGHLNGHGTDEGYGVGAVRVFGGSANVIVDIGTPNSAALADALASLDDLPSARAIDVSLAHFEGNALPTGD